MNKEIIERCSISGQKIIRKKEWENIEFNKGYKVSYKIIGDRIIHGKGSGKSTIEGLRGALGLGMDIIDEYFKGEPFVYIENFEEIINPSFGARKYYINFMKKLSKKNMKALIYYNVTPYFKFLINLSKKLNVFPFLVFVMDSYEKAVKLALNVLNENYTLTKYSKNKINKPEWFFKEKDGSLKIEIIDGKIFHSIPEGKVTSYYLEKVKNIRERIIKDYFADKKYYFVVDYSKINTTSKAKKTYINEINQLYKKYPFETYIIYNANKTMYLVTILSSSLIKFPYKFVKDFKSAMDFIKLKEEKNYKKRKSKKDKKRKNDIEQYVEEFLQFLGEINWEEIGISENYKKPLDHPLHQIYEAIAFIKNDLDELYLEKKKNEEEKAILEEKLHQSLKLEAIGKLAGAVAHDLNNVLMGIVSYPDYLLKIIPDIPENKKIRKYLLKIKNSGERAANIVQDLLTLSRQSAKNTEILNLNKIIKEYSKSPEFHKLKQNFPNVKIEFKLDKRIPYINGSKIHIYKTIMNLVKNSFESIEGNGKIIVKTKRIVFKDKVIKGYNKIENGEFIELSIKDNGIGISQKDLPKIFEPFYSKKILGRSGSGLGMMVVKGTMDEHNGYIEVKSNLGKGTEFKLYFPISKINPKVLINKKIRDFSGKGEKILVVDDEEDQRLIAEDILKSLNYNVKSVSSGEEAIDILQKEKFDLILLDMIMEYGISGLETFKRIKRLYPNQKAIIVSGFSESKQISEAQRLGIKKFIRKPYTIETIGKAVYELLNED